LSELTLTLIKLGFLAMLWIFVLSAVSVIRSDLFGAKVEATERKPKAAKAPKPARAVRRKRGAATQVVVAEGQDSGITVPLGDLPILIGRGSDATIQLDDDYVSTRHARFIVNGDQWFIEDLGSTNGTFLGTQRVTTPLAVNTGSRVRVGKTTIELRK
jgi:pSer/pThr/pTyr-binding forkhead associated (FHA) protein